MPLIGLEEVDWKNLHHAYGTAENVPDLLHELENAETKEQFDKVCYELWNLVNHQGTIYEATAISIKFMLQLTQFLVNDERKTLILCLVGVALSGLGLETVASIRHSLNVYDVVKNELDYLFDLLDADNESLRLASIFVLSFLSEQTEIILPRLLDCIENTKDSRIRASAIWAYSGLIKAAYRYPTEDDRRILIQWLSESYPAIMRYAAAFGYLRTIFYYHNLTLPPIIKPIAESFVTDGWKSESGFDDALKYMFFELSLFPDVKLIPSSNLWIEILNATIPNPVQAHLFCREILNHSFTRKGIQQSFESWLNHDSLKLREVVSEINYQFLTHWQQGYKGQAYQAGTALSDNQRIALKAVVDCEAFWEIPTNLFSFFYGLPDDRESLRELLIEE